MTNAVPLNLLSRVQAFTGRLGIRMPILLAPMSGACPAALSAAVANAGGMGGCGALLMNPEAIQTWVDDFRRQSDGVFQINLWIPDPPPARNTEAEQRQRDFLSAWGGSVSANPFHAMLPDFPSQCQSLLDAKPTVISSIMGLYPAAFVAEMKARNILWFATVTTVAEARAAEAAGADAIIAQGMEAGGHRGAFVAEDAERRMVGLFALLPHVADAVSIPVIAAGGIADARGVAAAIILGASAVQIGTAFLRSAESSIPAAYAVRLANVEAHETVVTRSWSGRAGRAIENRYLRTCAASDAAPPVPYPLQRALTRTMREDAAKAGDTDRMQMWAGQAAKFAQAAPAGQIAEQLWADALQYLS
jgi:nitronate monooxygenase